MEQSAEDIEEAESAQSTTSVFIRHLVQHAEYEAALLFTRGQYMLYQRRQGAVVSKGISSEALRTAFVEEPVDSGWLPEGVVRWGRGPKGPFIVKFIPAGRQEIRLQGQLSSASLIITPPLPALIFAGLHQTYFVWAVQGVRLDPSTPLFHAPFPNIYPDGRICFGSNHAPVAGWQTLDEAWELFLRAPFNADMAHGRSRAFGEDVREQLRTLAQSEVTSYPAHDLIPYVGGKRSVIGSRQIRTLEDIVHHFFLQNGDDE